MSDWAGKTPTKDEWCDILEKHAKWCRIEQGGKQAELRGADLKGAELQGAYLRGAELQGADLRGAELQGAYLRRAELRGADLRHADLHGAYLQHADLRGADLQHADLRGAYLRGAYLRHADLRGADLQFADLQHADLQDAKDGDLHLARTRILPEGDLIGWKKCRGGVIVQLLIPQHARRSHAFGRKCRAEAAVVMATFPADAKAESYHRAGFFYEKGSIVRPDKWDENWTDECGGGIHFYLSRIEAEAHK